MKHRSAAAAFALALLAGQAGAAHAGEYSDALSKCLVQSTTPDDRVSLVVWVYGAISVHPDLKAYSTMTEAQHAEVNKRAAKLLERLLTVDCRSQSVAALKYEGAGGFKTAFDTLGRVAMQGLLTDPEVARETSAMVQYLDKSKIEALGTEAASSKKP